MSLSPGQLGMVRHPNRGLIAVIIIESVVTVGIVLFAQSSVAVGLSAVFIGIVVVVLFSTFFSILYVGLKGRSIFLAVFMLLVSAASIVSLYAEIYIWTGLRDTVSTQCLNIPQHFATTVYFSTITWTTVGYGDLVPCGNARLIAASEAILGYLVMALLIAALTDSIQGKRVYEKRASG